MRLLGIPVKLIVGHEARIYTAFAIDSLAIRHAFALIRYKMPTTLKATIFLATPEDKERYKRAAHAELVTLSEWIRTRLNSALSQPINTHSTATHQNISPSPNLQDSPISHSSSPLLTPLRKTANSRQRQKTEKKKRLRAHENDDVVARKIGHKLGCDCVACERVRRMIGA
jgi:hypothetical protein